MMLTAHKTVAMFMRYVRTQDGPVRQAAELVVNRRKTMVAGTIATPVSVCGWRCSRWLRPPRQRMPPEPVRGQPTQVQPRLYLFLIHADATRWPDGWSAFMDRYLL